MRYFELKNDKLIKQKLKKGYVEINANKKTGGNKTRKLVKCCSHTSTHKKCRRKDGKVFTLPRRFSKKKCNSGKVRGFSKKASCAPYKYCKTKKIKKQFLYNPNDPKKSFDVYIDKNPEDTISIKYTTIDDVKNTIDKLEKLYREKKYTHKRIWQVGMIMKVRLEAIKKNNPSVKNIDARFNLANKYFKFLGERTKLKTFKERSDFVFSF